MVHISATFASAPLQLFVADVSMYIHTYTYLSVCICVYIIYIVYIYPKYLRQELEICLQACSQFIEVNGLTFL